MMLLFGRLGKAVLRDCGIFWVSVLFLYGMVPCSDASIDGVCFFFFFFFQYLSTLLPLFPCFCFHVFCIFV